MEEYEKELTNYIKTLERSCESVGLEIDLLNHEIKTRTRQLEIHKESLAEAKETIGLAKSRLAQE